MSGGTVSERKEFHQVVLRKEEIDRIVSRMAHEILERNRGAEDLVLIGIRTGGVYLGQRLRRVLETQEKVSIPMGVIDITLYRDDVATRHPRLKVGTTELPFSVDDKRVNLIDEVLYSGRTIRAALDAIMDFGRPRSIQLAVLIDRGGRELPIKADYVGRELRVEEDEKVEVSFEEEGKIDEVKVIRRAEG